MKPGIRRDCGLAAAILFVLAIIATGIWIVVRLSTSLSGPWSAVVAVGAVAIGWAAVYWLIGRAATEEYAMPLDRKRRRIVSALAADSAKPPKGWEDRVLAEIDRNRSPPARGKA